MKKTIEGIAYNGYIHKADIRKAQYTGVFNRTNPIFKGDKNEYISICYVKEAYIVNYWQPNNGDGLFSHWD